MGRELKLLCAPFWSLFKANGPKRGRSHFLMRDLRITRDFCWSPRQRRQRREPEPGAYDGCVYHRAFYTMDLPDTIRRRLDHFSRNVLFDQTQIQAVAKENDSFLPHGECFSSVYHRLASTSRAEIRATSWLCLFHTRIYYSLD